MDDDFYDTEKIETTFKIESSILKECFIFINFLCASLLLYIYFFILLKGLFKE